MSDRDEPEAKTRKRKKGRRRSLRVPVDEVPRPTQAAASADGGATVEMPAYDEGRVTEDDLGESSVERELPEEALEEIEEELDEELLGAPREPGSDAPLDVEATVAQEPASALAGADGQATIGGSAEAREADAPSLEVVIEDEDHGSDARDPAPAAIGSSARPPSRSEAPPSRASEPPASEPRASEPPPSDAPPSSAPPSKSAASEPPPSKPAASKPAASEPGPAEPAPSKRSEPPPRDPPRAPVVGVVVQRVVSVVSAPSASPPAAEARADTDTHPGTELAVDLDEEPELQVADPDAADLEELDVDLEDGAAASDAPPARDSAPELALEDELLEEEEAEAGTSPSVRPPPPPSNPSSNKAKDAPAEAATPPEAPSVAPVKKKKPRRHWWEELFNDDYLRTVPIPHPKVIERQCDFIEQRFGLAPGATLLDVGCGLGLHAVELTRRGYLVVGLDLSLPMLARAADEAQDHGFKINFLHADMREMNFDGAFDAVVCYGTTFGYFDDETNKAVVERLYRALKPRGLLLLDVVNRDFVIRNQPNLVWFEGDGCVVMEESQMNYITSRLEVKRTVILDNGRQRDNVYSLRSYSLHELGQILHHQGFRVVEVTGWEAHPGVFFGGDSPKLIILAERRPQGPPLPPGRAPSGEMQAVPDAAGDPEEITPDDEPPPSAAAEAPKEPSAAVNEALAEALEQSGELDVHAEPEQEDELEPEELAEDDLEEPEA